MGINIFRFFKSIESPEPLVEGMYADQYSNQQVRDYILSNYQKRFPLPKETPETHPWKFDPLDPPEHWKFDPYYEYWIKTQGK